jgi:adenylylsulfate kinase-like enzyme
VQAACVLLTGRAGAGKQTIGGGVVAELRSRGRPAGLVDGASVEQHLVAGSASLTWLCSWLVESGLVTIVSAAIPGRDDRERLRVAVPELLEVFVDAPADACEARGGRPDPAYEEPYAPDLRVPTHDRAPRASIAQVLSFLEERHLATGDAPGP